MDRNLALELVRVTETAALASAGYMGRGNKDAADQAAVDGMRKAFSHVSVKGKVVIGEGELDEAPMLYIGEEVGRWGDEDRAVDIAVDPLEGTVLIAKGLPNAIAVIAMAPEGTLLHAPDTYMKKIAVGPKAKGLVQLDAPVEQNLKAVAKALNKNLQDLTVIIQDRPRHDALIQEVRAAGCRIKLFGDGDVAAALATCFEDTGIDVFMGIGGAPEGVIAAVALKCLGGEMQGKLNPLSDEEFQRCEALGWHQERINKVLTLDDLVASEDVFFAATGVSDGDLLKGVTYLENNQAKTHSVVMRSKTGTIRFVDAVHRLDKNEILVEMMEKHR
ncbi:fructose-1,6-bisphosphatase II [Geosporobacter subterraneus DSM 17957]|uniref:Fructose-1,6-bisphosphatase n=1 Tax=Geosporobacter subterraneus DSM 17957 TaxID=1121919 RepID=A0A1M6MSY2_9FIRM|nr:class II fructose-bisphosphatase [Geosporobacter subterraneus]SHJ86554.1 fructose-1,6-bisphosphatase II [Geosporobacter subterraneus DSM 17957]